LGLILSVIFVYLILWKPHLGGLISGQSDLRSALFGESRLDLNHLWSILREVHLWPLLLAFMITPLHVLVRSHRWVLMVRNLSKLKLFDSFSLQMVGYLSNSILPLRMGDVVRGLMLARRQNIPTGSGVGTVLIERILDMFSLLVFAAIVGFLFPFPKEMAEGALVLGIIAGIGIIITIYLAVDKDPFGGKVGKVLGGGKVAQIVRQKGGEFVAGFAMFRQTDHHWVIVTETLLLWILYAIQGFLVLIAFDFTTLYPMIGQQPILSSFVVLVISAVGISLPAAPAGVGTFHAVLIFGLSLFQVPTDQAAGFALVIHGISAIFYIIFGLPFMWREGLHLSEIKQIEEAELKAKGSKKKT
jgi:hypothetical protein